MPGPWPLASVCVVGMEDCAYKLADTVSKCVPLRLSMGDCVTVCDPKSVLV